MICARDDDGFKRLREELPIITILSANEASRSKVRRLYKLHDDEIDAARSGSSILPADEA
jgi:hypothetical protein